MSALHELNAKTNVETDERMEKLFAQLAALRQEIAELKSDKADLELLLEMNTKHSDLMADDLFDKIEATLRENAKRFRTIAEATPVPVIISQVSDGEILYANQLAGPLVNLPTETLLGRKTVDFYEDPVDRHQLLEILKEQGYVSNYEIQAKKADDTPFWVAVSIQPLVFDNKPCLLSAFYDLTERKKAEEERARLSAIQQELDLAQQIQERLLPPSQPHWPELDVICYMASARNVGGDFYAYHPLTRPPKSLQRSGTREKSGRYAIAVGDVSGKGMPAALLMSLSFASLQAVIDQALDPSQLLRHLHQTIERYTKTTYQNCALCYAEITVKGGKERIMRVANAGCMEPIIRRVDGAVEWVEVTGLPLGARFEGALDYSEATLTLSAGDIVILSSDGVIEAMTEEREMFGFERFEHAVATGPMTNAEAMLAHIRGEVTDFVGKAEIQDDLTIAVLQM